MQTQSKDRKTSNKSTVIKGGLKPERPQFGPPKPTFGFKPGARFQTINRGRR